MSKTLTLTPKGLYTYYNNLASVPEGALLKANNVVINREGVAEPRRGIKYYSDLLTNKAKQLLVYKNTILAHIADKITYDDGTGTFTNFSGTFGAPDTYTRIKYLETKGNLYFTSDSGIKKISAKSSATLPSSTITTAGGVTSIGGIATALFNTGGFLDSNKKTAYKITWAIKDANGLFIQGTPSNAIDVTNPSTTNGAKVQLQIFIPDEVTTTDYSFRVFRTEAVDITGVISEEYNLVFEGNPTSGEITAGSLLYVDSLAEDLRGGGVFLYTNPISGEGINQANYKPPMAVDLDLFNNHMFYANTKLRHFKTTSLQSLSGFVSGTSNFIISDGTTTNTYTFRGVSEQSSVQCEAYSFVINGSYFLLNSANNERRYFVWYDKTGSTAEPSTLETVGRIGIKVSITASDNTGTLVAGHTLTQIGLATSDFIVTQLGAVLTITNTLNGYADATADANVIYTPTQFIISTLVQGLGEDISGLFVLLDDSTDESIAIKRTAESLCRMINQNPLETVTAQYISGLNEAPGNILLMRKDFNSNPFGTNTSHAVIKNNFFPALSASYDSDNSASVNGLYYSKLDQPESVPLLNYILIGSSDAPILRIKALRESLFIFKTDGVFRLSGFDGNFTVTLFDNTIILKVPDSVAVLNNEIYYYGTQGVAKISEVGKDVISKPIQDKLLPFITTAPNLASVGFGIAYETDRSYMLWTVKTKTDTVAKICYRFNVETQAWTEWEVSKTCAVLNDSSDMLYFGSGDVNYIEVERKNFDRFDYCDREISIALPADSISGDTLLPSGASNITKGDVIIQTQYLTISQFNQILRMIDADAFIGNISSPMYPTFSPAIGGNLASYVSALVAELNVRDTDSFTDTNGNTAYVFSGTNDYATIQVEWNKIVDRLNQSPTVFLSNYPKYTNSIPVEALVLNKEISNNLVTVNNPLPFLEGPMMLYKAITTEVQYVPQHGGDPVDFKQFSTAQAIFEYRSFYLAQLGFNSDLSTDFENIDFSLNSAATFGNFVFGTGAVWGGQGDKAPLRTYIPRNKQRSRFIGAKFTHTGALETYGLYGIAITFNSYSDKGYK